MKKFLSLVLALVMTMSLVTIGASAKDFTDDSTIEYAEAVDVISAIGVVDGYADGAFKPTATLTRGAAAKIICNMILGPTTAAALSADSAPFSDVPSNHTFAGYIAYCAKEGIINGYADGTFRPAGTLTGYAFMKMLLGALGYDADIEGYTGANWSIQVAKRAINIGLDDGNDEFVGTKAVTREEACLYAFNALQADMVEYKDKTSIIIGDVSVVTSADAKETGKTFAKTYFSKLDDKAVFDEFGRPATKWTWKNKEVGTYADEADATYTAQVKGGTIYSDLGLSVKDGTIPAEVIIDGVSADDEAITKKDEETKFGGNGVLTEVFLTENDDDVVDGAIVVEINTYINEIDEIDENDDDERIIVLKNGSTYVTEEFEEGDIVLYTVAGAKKEIQSVALAEKLEGSLTKISGSKYTIDGEVYELSATLNKSDVKVKVKNDVEFYLDAYGYIIKIDPAKDEITVDDLAYVLDTKGDEFDGYRAKLLFVDGSKKTVDTDEDYSKLEGTIVSFDVNDDEEYELDAVKNATGSTVTKGTPKVAGVTANSKTVYTYYLDGKDTETYTGYKNAPTATGTVVAYVKDSKAVAVFVIADSEDVDDATSSDELTYIVVKADADITDDGDNQYYTFNAVVDGEVTTLDVKTGAVSGDGVQVFKSYKTNKDGIVTSLTKSDKVFEDATTVKTGDDVITLDGEAYAYTDDVLVLVVDDDEITVSSIDGIKSKDGYYKSIQFSTDKDDVDVVILTKKA